MKNFEIYFGDIKNCLTFAVPFRKGKFFEDFKEKK